MRFWCVAAVRNMEIRFSEGVLEFNHTTCVLSPLLSVDGRIIESWTCCVAQIDRSQIIHTIVEGSLLLPIDVHIHCSCVISHVIHVISFSQWVCLDSNVIFILLEIRGPEGWNFTISANIFFEVGIWISIDLLISYFAKGRVWHNKKLHFSINIPSLN